MESINTNTNNKIFTDIVNSTSDLFKVLETSLSAFGTRMAELYNEQQANAEKCNTSACDEKCGKCCATASSVQETDSENLIFTSDEIREMAKSGWAVDADIIAVKNGFSSDIYLYLICRSILKDRTKITRSDILDIKSAAEKWLAQHS